MASPTTRFAVATLLFFSLFLVPQMQIQALDPTPGIMGENRKWWCTGIATCTEDAECPAKCTEYGITPGNSSCVSRPNWPPTNMTCSCCVWGLIKQLHH